MNLSNGNSFSNGNSMDLGGGNSYTTETGPTLLGGIVVRLTQVIVMRGLR